MQIILTQDELLEAAVAFVSSQIELRDGQEINASFVTNEDGETIAFVNILKAGTATQTPQERLKVSKAPEAPAAAPTRSRRQPKAQEQASEPEAKTEDPVTEPEGKTEQPETVAEVAAEAGDTVAQPVEVEVAAAPVAQTTAAPVGLFGTTANSAPPATGAKSLFANLKQN